MGTVDHAPPTPPAVTPQASIYLPGPAGHLEPSPLTDMTTTTPRTFGAWLKTQQRRDDPIGDLARDFLRDCRLRKITPDSIGKPSELRDLMTDACREASQALREAAGEYRRENVAAA